MDTTASDRPARRLLAVLVFSALSAVTVASAVLARQFVDDQERRLLEERASEVSALVSSLFHSQVTTLPLLGVLIQTAPESADALVDRVVPPGAPVVVGVVRAAGDDVVVDASNDPGLAPGAAVDGARLQVVQRASVSDGVVSTVRQRRDARQLLFAVSIDDQLALFQEYTFEPDVLERNDSTEAFSELDGAVYAADGAATDRLLFATTQDLPIRGDVVERSVTVGADTWTVVVRAREPLVGTLAASAPWLVLAVGLVSAALVSTLIEVVNRRRSYALRLVDARTDELRVALTEMERLEEGQRRAREAAEEANRSKSEFLSRMSHELRTPLNAVLGFGQLLESSDDLDADDHEAVKQILKGGWHLLDLINEVLDITRIETGRFQLSPEPVLVSEVVADVAQLTAPLAAQANIRLGAPATETCRRYVLADRQRLNQVLLNLVSNAIKYNRVGGRVSLSCTTVDPDRLRICVEDTGAGIRDEHLDRLFTPFERLGAEETSIEGTGIGLALSRRLAEAMGGTIDLDTTLGEGTTFWVELPVVEGPVERYDRLHDAPTTPAPIPVDGEQRTVLYIEDNLANLRLVERVLEDDPRVTLLAAAHGQLGIDLARQHRPALVLLDLHLPDLGGEDVLRTLRDDPSTSSIPVVVVSADATTGQSRRLLAQGAWAYLTKPIDIDELRRIVDGIRVPNP